MSALQMLFAQEPSLSQKCLPEGLLGCSLRLSSAKGRISHKQSQGKIY